MPPDTGEHALDELARSACCSISRMPST
jgi:hypothetical protein